MSETDIREQANCYINIGQRIAYLRRYQGVVDEGVDDEELIRRITFQSAYGGCHGHQDFDDEDGLDMVRRYNSLSSDS